MTVDLLRGEAWQRCWDSECAHHRPRLVAGPRARAGVDGRLASPFPSPLTPEASPPLHPTLTLTPHAARRTPHPSPVTRRSHGQHSALGETIRAKHPLPLPPADCLPDHLQLHRFEEECGLLAPAGHSAAPGPSTGLVRESVVVD